MRSLIELKLAVGIRSDQRLFAFCAVEQAPLEVLYRLTEPLLRPIRRVIPSISGVDFSPVIALIGLWFLGRLIREYAFQILL